MKLTYWTLVIISSLVGLAFTQNSVLTIGLHFSDSQRADKTLRITGPEPDLNIRDFDNTLSRYKIDGEGEWEFYDSTYYRNLLFTATGPVGWTPVYNFNDRVSSVRPVIRREPGEPGAPGEPGEDGNPGTQGEPGTIDYCRHDQMCTLKGEPGNPGEKGVAGSRGADGVNGERGDRGEMGEVGFDGEKGSAGDDGESGESGEDGMPGMPGRDGQKFCDVKSCGTSLGKCYGVASASLTVKCKQGYAATSIWQNSRFWGLRCCQINGRMRSINV